MKNINNACDVPFTDLKYQRNSDYSIILLSNISYALQGKIRLFPE